MDAAERLFVEKGVAETSIDEVVAAADVAKGTYYLHYDSKESLLAALQQRFIATFCAIQQSAMERRGAEDWDGRLRSWIEAGIGAYLDRVALHDVVFHDFRPHDRRAKHDNAVVDSLAAFLEDGARAGAWSVVDARLTAIMLFHALHGAVDDAIAAQAPADRKRLARALERFFRRAVARDAV
jgi:AcrR family transcriptional regulator